MSFLPEYPLALGQPGAFFFGRRYNAHGGTAGPAMTATSDLERIALAAEKAGRVAAEMTALGLSEVASMRPDEFIAAQREWFRGALRENLLDFGALPEAFDHLVDVGMAAFDDRLKEALANQGQEGRG
jgi:hypothetical protein